MSQKLLELETSNLVGGFVLGMPSRRTNTFPESGRGLGHVTPTIFGSTVGYPSDSLASCLHFRSQWPWPLTIRVTYLLVQQDEVTARRIARQSAADPSYTAVV